MADETKEAAPAAKPEETPATPEKTDEKKVIQLESDFRDSGLKTGEVFLKRTKGAPRWRKIVAKNHRAQLFFRFANDWKQLTALGPQGKVIKDYSWHLRHKWQTIKKDEAEKLIEKAGKAAHMKKEKAAQSNEQAS